MDQMIQKPKKYTVEEIKAQKGKFDEDKFYILTNGDFYDPEGFYFDTEGFDELGGYYDDNGEYVAPPGLTSKDGELYVKHDDFADYYDELVGSDDENEFISDEED